MRHSNMKAVIVRSAIWVILIVSITTMLLCGILLYKSSFNNENLSNWLFYTAMLFILLAVIPVYTVLTSSNDVSYRYGEHMVRGSMDISSRVNDIAQANKFRFTIIMFVCAVFFMVLSAIANNVL
ncbi:MAG TPA: hypothetical protein VEF53_02920 [Patescibacteria group bacterium]|nr:hypothetical protein [Patescibacteria group bacterium]